MEPNFIWLDKRSVYFIGRDTANALPAATPVAVFVVVGFHPRAIITALRQTQEAYLS